MYPMDYEEFLWAVGDDTTFSLLGKCYEAGRGLGDPVNRKLLRQFRLYMLIGGMPQAVNEYIETNNFRKVDVVKRDILTLYEDDLKRLIQQGDFPCYLIRFRRSLIQMHPGIRQVQFLELSHQIEFWS